MKPDHEIIAHYAAIARPLILEFFPPNCCVAASRVTIECLRSFGVDAVAVAMKLVVECRPREVAYLVGLSRAERRKAKKQAAAWTDRAQPDAWNGHLVVVARGERRQFMIDPSFDQASMPGHGVTIPPCILVVPVGAEIPPDSIGAELELVTDDGEELRVRYIPSGDSGFTHLPAWGTDHVAPLVQMICERMRTV